MTVTIFHNPKCGTSRNVLAMIRESGVEPTVVDYLKAGWEPATLEHLASASGAGLKGLLRKKEAKAAELLASDADDAAVLAAMIENPNIVERPIVETPKGVALCRPSEAVFPLLDNPPARFVKEDGEVVGG
ncbi:MULTISPECIES: ArsC/Spx/MgsR family protein [unclassified Brevundimonas]|uniref:ArsC/Spx/MgsR family protein n=1 Tax=unclassified Brevundimonas TaxID=2622653 RepID=UPI003F8FAADC